MKRSSIRKSRSKSRPGRVKGEDMHALREAVWERDGGLCCFCGLSVDFDAGEMAHLRGKRMWGDGIDNIRGPAHKSCHQDSHNAGGKPVPKAEWRAIT